MPAEARVLDEAVARGHPMDAMAEQAASIADFLRESPAFGEGVHRGREYQRMAAPDAHILVVPGPVRKAFIGVMAQEARQCVPDACERAVFAEVVDAAPAAALAGCRVMERAVVDGVTPEPAAEVTNELGVGHTRKCARHQRLGSLRPGNIFFVHAAMKALVITRPGIIELREEPRPEDAGECLIRVLKAGICGTDLQLLEGYAEFTGIPGHEFVGVVEQAPGADSAWMGRRVVGEINVGCRHCDWCARGIKEHCANRNVVGIREHDGAFAEYLSLPAVNLHAVPETMDDETAVFAEPVAAACRIFEQMTVDPQARVAIVGDGRMGLLVAQVLRTVAPDVTVLGRHDHKLAIARALGLSAERSDRAVPSSARFDIVVDVTGRPDGLRRALELVKPRGTVVMKSTFHGEAPVATWPIVVDEVTLVGSRCGPFRPALDLLASGAVQVKPLISRVATLDDYESAFAEARRSLKILFEP